MKFINCLIKTVLYFIHTMYINYVFINSDIPSMYIRNYTFLSL